MPLNPAEPSPTTHVIISEAAYRQTMFLGVAKPTSLLSSMWRTAASLHVSLVQSQLTFPYLPLQCHPSLYNPLLRKKRMLWRIYVHVHVYATDRLPIQPALKPVDGFETGQPALKRAGPIEP